MGKFIAIMRKANGLTQEELAERLSVSNKSVSRWENDGSYPDLSLIPVIAELFNVTSDEILRGARKSSVVAQANIIELEKSTNPAVEADAGNETSDIPQMSKKAEKLRRRLILKTVNDFKHLSFISVLLSVLGFAFYLVALFADPIFAAFFALALAISVILQIILNNTAKAALFDFLEEEGDVKLVKAARSIANYTFNIIAFNIVLASGILIALLYWVGSAQDAWVVISLFFYYPALVLIINIVRMLIADKKYFELSNKTKLQVKRLNKLFGFISLGSFVLALAGYITLSIVQFYRWYGIEQSPPDWIVSLRLIDALVYYFPFLIIVTSLMAIIAGAIYIVKRVSYVKEGSSWKI